MKYNLQPYNLKRKRKSNKKKILAFHIVGGSANEDINSIKILNIKVMAKDLSYYENKLRQMITQRRKVDVIEPWIESQLEGAAMNWQMLSKLHDELMKGELISYENGSTGQTKKIANPLLVAYKECQRTHLLNLEALGLNYKTLPSKMKEKVSNVPDENDPLVELFKGIMDNR